MKRLLPIIIMTMVMSGCAGMGKNTVIGGSPDPADVTLSQAASEIQRDMRKLSAGSYSAGPALPSAPASSGLMSRVDYRYTGEVETFLKDAASKTGYEYKVTGKPGNQALVVKLYTLDKQSWFELLQNAGVQLGSRADIHVDDTAKTLTLAYGGIAKDTPPTIKGAQEKAPKGKSQPSRVATPRPAPQAPAQKAEAKNEQLLVWKGDIAGALPIIAGKLGYTYRTEGPAAPIQVNIASGGRTWEQITALLNDKMKFANLFIDHTNRVVVLKYWK